MQYISGVCDRVWEKGAFRANFQLAPRIARSQLLISLAIAFSLPIDNYCLWLAWERYEAFVLFYFGTEQARLAPMKNWTISEKYTIMTYVIIFYKRYLYCIYTIGHNADLRKLVAWLTDCTTTIFGQQHRPLEAK